MRIFRVSNPFRKQPNGVALLFENLLFFFEYNFGFATAAYICLPCVRGSLCLPKKRVLRVLFSKYFCDYLSWYSCSTILVGPPQRYVAAPHVFIPFFCGRYNVQDNVFADNFPLYYPAWSLSVPNETWHFCLYFYKRTPFRETSDFVSFVLIRNQLVQNTSRPHPNIETSTVQ